MMEHFSIYTYIALIFYNQSAKFLQAVILNQSIVTKAIFGRAEVAKSLNITPDKFPISSDQLKLQIRVWP